jgi:hypothetical protein
MKCGEHKRLVLIEPQDGGFNLLTCRCGACASDESFPKAVQRKGESALHAGPVDIRQRQGLTRTRLGKPHLGKGAP